MNQDFGGSPAHPGHRHGYGGDGRRLVGKGVVGRKTKTEHFHFSRNTDSFLAQYHQCAQCQVVGLAYQDRRPVIQGT